MSNSEPPSSTHPFVLGVAVVGIATGCAPTDRAPRDVPKHAAVASADDEVTPADLPVLVEPDPPVEVTPQPEPTPPVPWSSLQPIHHVRTFRDVVLYVLIRETNASVARRHPKAFMDSVEFAPEDARIPEYVGTVTDPVVLLLEGEHRSSPVTRVAFSSSPFGDAWSVAFAFRGPDTTGIALPRAPHPDATLTRPSEETVATGTLRALLTAAVPREFRPGRGVDVMTASAPARLPDGATNVVAGWWSDEEGPESSGVVISVDDTNARVHQISIHRDYLLWARISWVADLDGDGIDEIGWGHGGIEDEAHFVTHFADGKQELLSLYAAGH